MIHISIRELGELQESLAALDKVLETLDRIGAVIAAIHVDAAIDQLRNNLDLCEAQAPVVKIRSAP